MKLRITIEKREYVVDVDVIDGATGQSVPAASVVVTKVANEPAKPAPAVAPLVAAPTKTTGAVTEVQAPLAGVILDVRVKVGDAVRANDPVVTIEASRVISSGDAPMIGSIRAEVAGTVKEVLVKPGSKVSAHDVLMRIVG
jgi:biotin carboxyl carrier protein